MSLDTKKSKLNPHIYLGMLTREPEKEKLNNTLKSILNQSYQNFTLIIHDNCSKTDTYSLIKEIISTDQRINV